MNHKGLCYRCEYRSQFKETGEGPRYECKTDSSVYSCYMYRPVRPVLLVRDRDDRRPIAGPWAFSARAHRPDREPKVELFIEKQKLGYLLYWRPTKILDKITKEENNYKKREEFFKDM